MEWNEYMIMLPTAKNMFTKCSTAGYFFINMMQMNGFHQKPIREMGFCFHTIKNQSCENWRIKLIQKYLSLSISWNQDFYSWR